MMTRRNPNLEERFSPLAFRLWLQRYINDLEGALAEDAMIEQLLHEQHEAERVAKKRARQAIKRRMFVFGGYPSTLNGRPSFICDWCCEDLWPEETFGPRYLCNVIRDHHAPCGQRSNRQH
jgi:hypothetical protein